MLISEKASQVLLIQCRRWLFLTQPTQKGRKWSIASGWVQVSTGKEQNIEKVFKTSSTAGSLDLHKTKNLAFPGEGSSYLELLTTADIAALSAYPEVISPLVPCWYPSLLSHDMDET